MPKTFQSIVVLTGAGVSAESGIQTFRAADGLWENHRVEDVASPQGYAKNPALVQEFYNQRRKKLLSAEVRPNQAHIALAEFETRFAGQLLVVTQNIDDLHERAGSQALIHMHGELLKMRCTRSENIFPITEDITTASVCKCCGMANQLRPHIVWFGEMPLAMDRIEHALSQCDLFISIGTSGNVYPAAGFFQLAKHFGAHTVELNLEPSMSGSSFDEVHYGPATDVVPKFLATI